MTGRAHLRLVRGGALVESLPMAQAPTVPHRLAARVVSAAQRWAAEMDAVGDLVDISTPELQARRNLADAVHDLELHQVASTRHHDVR